MRQSHRKLEMGNRRPFMVGSGMDLSQTAQVLPNFDVQGEQPFVTYAASLYPLRDSRLNLLWFE